MNPLARRPLLRALAMPALVLPAIVSLALLLPAATAHVAEPNGGEDADGSKRELPGLPPFLNTFLSPHGAPVVAKRVEWASAIGKHEGLLARPDDGERLPALMLIENGPAGEFSQRAARDLSGIGYVVLVVELDPDRKPTGDAEPGDEVQRRERRLTQLSAAARWLKRRDDVFPDRVGALGFGNAARWALEAAAAQGLEAAVLVDPVWPLAADAAQAAGLRHSAVLVVVGAADASLLDGEHLERFGGQLRRGGVEHRVLEFKSAKPGFLDSFRSDRYDAEAADRAWFEIYEFLGKHVEDAPLKALLAAQSARGSGESLPRQHVSSISDLMRAVNAPSGVRGAAAQSLGQQPREEKDWRELRARAALLADAGELLLGLTPPKGSEQSWQRHVAAYCDAAAEMADAADQQDYPAAKQALDRLNASCAKCHLDHR